MSTFTIDTATSRATPSPVPGKRMTAPSIRGRKIDGAIEQPIVMLTAYTMRMAQLLDPHCDMLLVGDSLGDGDDVRAWRGRGARQLACVGCGRHAVRLL
jgi:3-methyl-2-oxobutanoate hydroxymethyltransferase